MNLIDVINFNYHPGSDKVGTASTTLASNLSNAKLAIITFYSLGYCTGSSVQFYVTPLQNTFFVYINRQLSIGNLPYVSQASLSDSSIDLDCQIDLTSTTLKMTVGHSESGNWYYYHSYDGYAIIFGD